MKLRTLTALALTALAACSADVRRDGDNDPAIAASAVSAPLRRAAEPAWARATIADLEGASTADLDTAGKLWTQLSTPNGTRIRRIDSAKGSQAPLFAAWNDGGLVIVHGRLAVAMPGYPAAELPVHVVMPWGGRLDVPEAGAPSDYQAALAKIDLGLWLGARKAAQKNARELEVTQNWMRVYMALGAAAYGGKSDADVDGLLTGLLASLGDAEGVVGYPLADDLAVRAGRRVAAVRGRADRAAWARSLAVEASATMNKHITSSVPEEVANRTLDWVAHVTSTLWDRPGTVTISGYELDKAVADETGALFSTYKAHGLADLEAAARDWLASVEKQLPHVSSPHDGATGLLWMLEDRHGLRYGVSDMARVHERVSRATIGRFGAHDVPKGPPLPRATQAEAQEALALMKSACEEGSVGAEAGFLVTRSPRAASSDWAASTYESPWSAGLATWALDITTNAQVRRRGSVASFVRDAVMNDEMMPRANMDLPGCAPRAGDFGIEARKGASPTAYARMYGIASWDGGLRAACGPDGSVESSCSNGHCRVLDTDNITPDDGGASSSYNTVAFVRPGGFPQACLEPVTCKTYPEHHACIVLCKANPLACRNSTCAQNPKDWMCSDQMGQCVSGDPAVCKDLCDEDETSEACRTREELCDRDPSAPGCEGFDGTEPEPDPQDPFDPTGVGGGDDGDYGGSSCFVAGTPITMADGSTRAIEDVKAGDSVMAYDVALGEALPAPVVRTFVHTNVEGTVKLDSGLEMTPNHPVYAGGRWVRADRVAPGDAIVRLDGVASQGAKVASVMSVSSKQTVYNLEVARYHDYFAGGVLVHNKMGDEEEDYDDLFP